MRGAFAHASSLTELDLSSWDTSHITRMGEYTYDSSTLTGSGNSKGGGTIIEGMFSGCTNLKTIYVSDKWTMAASSSENHHENMFYNCKNLVGGNGTVFNSNYTDKTYAKIDKPGEPGYFTYKASN